MLQLVPLFPRSKKKTNEDGFTSGMNIMRRFLKAIFCGSLKDFGMRCLFRQALYGRSRIYAPGGKIELLIIPPRLLISSKNKKRPQSTILR